MGPPGLEAFWSSTQAFTHRPQHRVQVSEVLGRQEGLDTGEVVIEAVPLVPPTATENENEDEDEDEKADTSTPFTATVTATVPTHVCYVCQTKSLPGRFDIQKAKALGVPVGPLCATLKAGTDVTLADGVTVVRSVDVMGASEPPRFVAVICDVAPVTAATTTFSGDLKENDSGASLLQMLVSNPYWTRSGLGALPAS